MTNPTSPPPAALPDWLSDAVRDGICTPAIASHFHQRLTEERTKALEEAAKVCDRKAQHHSSAHKTTIGRESHKNQVLAGGFLSTAMEIRALVTRGEEGTEDA